LSDSPSGRTRHAIVLEAVLRILRPLVRLLLRHGVTYPELANALKRVFVDAARQELSRQGMASTDSAVTLLCGVHRKDVRELTRGVPGERQAQVRLGAPPVSLSGELVAAWLGRPDYLDEAGAARVLPREAFDALAGSITRDVRPRALLDELVRLGAVDLHEDGSVSLRKAGFAPRAGLAEMAELMAANVGDHAAAAAANLQGDENFLEQALYVDRLRPESVAQVRQAARLAWSRALRQVLAEAQARFGEDEALADPAQQARRTQRARFGIYFFSEEES
jgi:Family of unknown function (DUF6502)